MMDWSVGVGDVVVVSWWDACVRHEWSEGESVEPERVVTIGSIIAVVPDAHDVPAHIVVASEELLGPDTIDRRGVTTILAQDVTAIEKMVPAIEQAADQLVGKVFEHAPNLAPYTEDGIDCVCPDCVHERTVH